MARRDFFTSLALIAFSVWVFFEALEMPYYPERGGTMLTAPGLVPGALALILGLCGMIMLLQATLRRGPAVEGGAEALAAAVGAPMAEAEAAEPEVKEVAAAEPGGLSPAQRLVLMGILGIGYGAVLIGWLPFWLATFVFVFLSITILEWRPGDAMAGRLRRTGVAAAIALLTAVSVTYVFQELFLVRLP